MEKTGDVGGMIEALKRPEAYPHSVTTVEVRQTHISVVFLAGAFAYKIKKPVNLGFVDFSTLEKRRHFCEEEVRLNRRLAPQVYLGVIPVGMHEGVLRFDGTGTPLEWAVRMQRLPEDATLSSRLRRGAVTEAEVRALAARLADFYRQAQRGERIAAFGGFDAVAANAGDNFRQTQTHIGVTVSAAVYHRVQGLTERRLHLHRDLIESRAARGVPCDTHGDLRLEHVYCFPERSPPDDLVMIDCIEFADRFRYADPVADLAFLEMDLAYHGRRDLGRVLAKAYFDASGDREGAVLLPLYSAYRAVVRAKVAGMELDEREIDDQERKEAAARGRAHWLVALGKLEKPSQRPALVMMAGLPGSGKSTLAQSLAAQANFTVLRSDGIRKELAGANATNSVASFERGIYAEEWTERTYGELCSRARGLLWQGERVLIDANFRSESQRQTFAHVAERYGVPALFVHCAAPPELARVRLQTRRKGPSDADWDIYQHLASSWQTPSPALQALLIEVNTAAPPHDCERAIVAELQRREMA